MPLSVVNEALRLQRDNRTAAEAAEARSYLPFFHFDAKVLVSAANEFDVICFAAV